MACSLASGINATTVIDVMVAYDQAHLSKYGHEGILTEADWLLEFTEEVFANGGLDVDFRIVHLFHDPVCNRFGEAFQRFYSTRFAYTRAFGADLFIYFAKNGGFHATGTATLPGNYCFANIWFYGNDEARWLLAHEIGHTFGAGHEDGCREGAGMYSYSNAFVGVDSDKPAWTLMASGWMGNASRIPCFSSPELLYNGKAIGRTIRHNRSDADPERTDNLATVRNYLPVAAARESQDDYLCRDSVVLPDACHWLHWLGYVNLSRWHEMVHTSAGIGRYFHHQRLGWCWVPLGAAPGLFWSWSWEYAAWVLLGSDLPRCAYVADGVTGWLRL